MNAYKHYLQQATTHQEFRTRFNQLARNARGWMDLTMEIRSLPELAYENLQEAIAIGEKLLHGFYNKALPVYEREDREDKVELKKHLKKRYRKRTIARDFFEQDMEDLGLYDTDSEELIPVIHGGDLGRIYAALHHGRGYRMEVSVPNPAKKTNEQIGLQFHSKYPDRARLYARDSANARCGVKAVLMAKVPRKYVYNNGGSGYGDEYNLPYWYYQYLQDIHIITEFDEDYWCIEGYYREHYLGTLVQV